MPLDVQLHTPEAVLTSKNPTLAELVDGLLHHGVVLRGEVWLTVADVDLVFLGLDVVLSSPSRMREDRSCTL